MRAAIRTRLARAAAIILVLGSAGAGSAARDVAVLRVRGVGGERSLAVASVSGANMIEATPLVRLLGGTIDTAGADRVGFRIGAAVGDLYLGSPFVRVDATVWPLAVAPRRHQGRLFVPLQFATELLPKIVGGLTYDAAKRELRMAQPTVAVAKPVGPKPATATTAGGKSSRYLVVVDPGHGGRDVGMSGRLPDGRYVYEKTIVLGIALKLADELRRLGVDVHMTRSRDTLVALADRGRIANRKQGDLFLSIHVNAPGPAERRPLAVRGFETYFLAEAQSEDERRVEAMENEAVRFETAPAQVNDDALSFILNDMLQNEHLRESSELASAMQFGLLNAHPGPNRGVKRANLSVLRNSFMPAVLIETGFGSNPAEALWLSSAAGQRALAASIAQATVQYLAGFEARSKASRTQ